MGCASSTPMVATAGSEILKAATHVTEDVTKNAESAVQDVTQSLGKTLDNAKETVGTAVTGIAHNLGNAVMEKTEQLDEAKNNLMEKLHLSNAQGEHHKGEIATKPHDDKYHDELDADEDDDDDADECSTRRAPTPANDIDSLKTTSPEPEIERALANHYEDSPPTPKPSLSELEKLTTAMKQTTKATIDELVKESDEKLEKARQALAEKTNDAPVDKSSVNEEQKRPSTTEWEQYADSLSRKQDRARFVGRFGRLGQPMNNAPPPSLNSAFRDYSKPSAIVNQGLRDDDSCLSDPYYNSVSSPMTSARSSARPYRDRLPRGVTATTAANARKFQREFSNAFGFKKPIDPMRSSTSNKLPVIGRKFDYNPNRSRLISSPGPSRRSSHSRLRVSSPTPSTRIFSRSRTNTAVKTRTNTNSPMPSTRIFSHPANPMKARSLAVSRVSSPIRVIGANSPTRIPLRTKTTLIGSPITTRTTVSSFTRAPIDSTVRVRGNWPARERGSSPVRKHGISPDEISSKNAHLIQSNVEETPAANFAKASTPNIMKKTLRKSNNNSPTSPIKARSLSRSSHSSTSIVIKSDLTSPISRTPSRTPSRTSLLDNNGINNENGDNGYGISEIAIIGIGAESVENLLSETLPHTNFRTISPANSSHYFATDRRLSSTGLLRSSTNLGINSSYRNTPLGSPFSVRKTFSEYDDECDKENKEIFVTDLSSVVESRSSLTPSPYKIRDRCAVCCNKYVIK